MMSDLSLTFKNIIIHLEVYFSHLQLMVWLFFNYNFLTERVVRWDTEPAE